MLNVLNEQHRISYENFIEFSKLNIMPYSTAWERAEAIPREVIQLCAKLGYLGGTVPVEYGGLGWDVTTYGLFTEALGNASLSLSGLFNVHTMIEQTILKWGNDMQKNQWLPKLAKGEVIGAFALTEPVAGSDVQGIESCYSRLGDELILNGKKRWITFGEIADIYLVFGKLDGKPTAALVERDTPGFTVKPVKDMLGFKCGHLAVLEFDNCKIDEKNIIGKPGFAFTHIAPYALEFGRVSVAFGALGILRSCLEICSTNVLKRKTFGARLIEHGNISEMITDMGVDLEAARLLCFSAAAAKDLHQSDATDKVMMAKYFTSRAAVKHSANAVQIMGAVGCNESYFVSRHYRDSKTLEIIEGSNQIHQMLLGKGFARKNKKQISFDLYG